MGTRHEVNSIPELMANSNSGIGIYYLKKMELINLELGLKFPTNKLNPQNNLPFNFLIQKYFFRDNPTWNINYSEYVFQVGTRIRYS